MSSLNAAPAQTASTSSASSGTAAAGADKTNVTSYSAAETAPAQAPVRSYTTSYAEEIKQKLGLENGRMSLFSAHMTDPSGMAATFSGGLGSKGLSLRMDW